MANSIDLASLLSSSEGINCLHNGSNMFGIRVFAMESKISNCVDYGVTTILDWQPEFPVPVGYGQLQDDKSSRIMSQSITIFHGGHDQLPVIISDVQVLPRDTFGRPVFRLTDSNDGNSSNVKGTIIQAGQSAQLKLECIIPGGFEGFLGR